MQLRLPKGRGKAKGINEEEDRKGGYLKRTKRGEKEWGLCYLGFVEKGLTHTLSLTHTHIYNNWFWQQWNEKIMYTCIYIHGDLYTHISRRLLVF